MYAAAWTRVLITHIHARAAGDGTSLAVEAARSAAGGGVGGHRGDCRLRGRGRHALFADHLAAHSEEAAVRDWSSCVVKVALCQLCKLGGQWAMSNTVTPLHLWVFLPSCRAARGFPRAGEGVPGELCPCCAVSCYAPHAGRRNTCEPNVSKNSKSSWCKRCLVDPREVLSPVA